MKRKTHVFPSDEVLGHTIPDLPRAQATTHFALRVAYELFHAQAHVREPREDDSLERRLPWVSLGVPICNGLLDLWDDELVQDVVVNEGWEEVPPSVKERESAVGLGGGPVVAIRWRCQCVGMERVCSFRAGTYLILERTLGSQIDHSKLS